MEWVAPADPLEGEPEPFEHPVFFNRFERIFRAGREEATAMAQKWAKRRLIKADQKDHNGLHEPIRKVE